MSNMNQRCEVLHQLSMKMRTMMIVNELNNDRNIQFFSIFYTFVMEMTNISVSLHLAVIADWREEVIISFLRVIFFFQIFSDCSKKWWKILVSLFKLFNLHYLILCVSAFLSKIINVSQITCKIYVTMSATNIRMRYVVFVNTSVDIILLVLCGEISIYLCYQMPQHH